MISGRVDATRCSKLTGGMPPVPPALTRGLIILYSLYFLLQLDVILDEASFVHFYKGPTELLEPMYSHIVFLLDLSTSMAGQKLSMAKETLILLLEDLTERDNFSIVLFNQKWVKEMPDVFTG